MFRKLFAVLVPMMLFVIVAGPPQAVASDAGTSATKPGKTNVSIEVWPKRGLFGYVKSPRRGCEAGRLVRVFKKLPGNRLEAIGRDRALKTDRGFMWSLKSRRASSGTVVASAPRSARCARDAARERIPLKSGGIPPCPSLADICELEPIKVSDSVSFEDKLCPIWGKFLNGTCKSKLVAAGRVPICCFSFGVTQWRVESPSRREFKFDFWDGREIGKPSIDGPWATGWVPNDRSAKYFVKSFSIPGFNQDRNFWYTPEIMDAAPGSPGGPLYLNWDAGMDNNFDYYLRGFLYRN